MSSRGRMFAQSAGSGSQPSEDGGFPAESTWLVTGATGIGAVMVVSINASSCLLGPLVVSSSLAEGRFHRMRVRRRGRRVPPRHLWCCCAPRSTPPLTLGQRASSNSPILARMIPGSTAGLSQSGRSAAETLHSTIPSSMRSRRRSFLPAIPRKEPSSKCQGLLTSRSCIGITTSPVLVCIMVMTAGRRHFESHVAGPHSQPGGASTRRSCRRLLDRRLRTDQTSPMRDQLAAGLRPVRLAFHFHLNVLESE